MESKLTFWNMDRDRHIAVYRESGQEIAGIFLKPYNKVLVRDMVELEFHELRQIADFCEQQINKNKLSLQDREDFIQSIYEEAEQQTKERE